MHDIGSLLKIVKQPLNEKLEIGIPMGTESQTSFLSDTIARLHSATPWQEVSLLV